MVKYSYDKIFKIVKRIRGFTLDDFPCNLQEIMQAFDNRQNIILNAIQIGTQLLDDTRLWIRILEDYEGRGSSKYMVASIKITHACLEIVHDMVEFTCSKAAVIDLQPHVSHDLPLRVNELQNLLGRIGKLYMIPETHKVYINMVKKLLIAQEHIESLVMSDQALSAFEASHSCTA